MIPVLLLFNLTVCIRQLSAQELFVFSEPASNMPAHSLSAKLTGRFALPSSGRLAYQRYSPEIMAGLNKHWMVHATAFVSDFYSAGLRFEALRLYAKYRFLSKDEVHRHFRMAAFAEAAWSQNPFVYEDINLFGDNTGAEAGLIATQLINRLAISGTVGYLSVFPRQSRLDASKASRDALNYTASAGYLVLPKVYSSFNQTNLNLYFEMTGMRGLGDRGYMLDFAPAIQVIFRSNFKVNAGYKFQVAGNMHRISERSWVLAFERTFLGALKRRKSTPSN